MKRPTSRPFLLHPAASMQWYEGTLSLAELDQAHAAGRMPLNLAEAMGIGEAAGVALLLPGVRDAQGEPIGYGVLPPQGAEPVVRVSKGLRDLANEPIRAGARGLLGAMWHDRRRPDRVVFRLWFKAETGHGIRPDGTDPALRGQFRIVDCYDDAIASVCGIEGQAPHLTGWQVVRLDGDPAPVEPTSSSTSATLYGANGRPVRA